MRCALLHCDVLYRTVVYCNVMPWLLVRVFVSVEFGCLFVRIRSLPFPYPGSDYDKAVEQGWYATKQVAKKGAGGLSSA